jgi:hypothetical protein
LELVRKYICFLGLLFLSVRCENTNSVRVDNEFTKKDSTDILKVILDSLNTEMYAQWFMEPLKKGTQYSEEPSFNPRIYVNINSKEEILIRDEINKRFISELILEFYTSNLFTIKNLETPYYSKLAKSEIISEIKRLENEINTIKTTHKEVQDFIQLRKETLNDWKKRLSFLKILGTDTIREPSSVAGIELNYPENSKINEAVLDSIFMGFYKIREFDAQLYFNESYAKIFWKANTKKDTKALKQLEVFKLLHPVKVLDHKKCQCFSTFQIPPPITIEY